MKNLIWLASYPKSGNTWFRILLESIINNGGKSIDINRLSLSSFGFIPRYYFDEFLELDSTELKRSETNEFKREYYIHYAKNLQHDTFLKTHDANIHLKDKLRLIPEEATRLVIYIVRNPLDITASFANHFGVSIDEAIMLMCNRKFTIFRTQKGVTSNVDQVILDWSGHVESWLDAEELPVVLVKYEDLLTSPVMILKRIFDRLRNVKVSERLIEAAVENNSFSNLIRQESINGFHEKSVKTRVFFRKGKANSWKEELTHEQVNRIIQAHGKVMDSLGYLPNHKPTRQ